MMKCSSWMCRRISSRKPINHGGLVVKQVFISYRHVKPDEDLALALEQALTGAGCPVFIDRNMLLGTEWQAEIERQLRAAAFFVVLLSAESIRSDMVREEIRLAHELKQQGSLRILPIRVDYTGALPYDLGGYLNPLQYAIWDAGKPPGEIVAAIRLAIESAKELPHEGQSGDGGDTQADIQQLHEATEQRGAPLPQVDPRVLDLAMERGAMHCESPFYVRRPADDAMDRQLQLRGTTTIVKGARQMGKSSLLVRAAAQARDQGRQVCYIDLQGIDETRLSSLENVLLYLMHRLARDLKTAAKPKDYWDEYLGPKDSATDFIEYGVLDDADKSVVLLLDEADRVFPFPYRNDFFALLRFWTNRRADKPCWNRFDLVVAHSTDPVLWIDDINQSPFNVGYSIVMNDFDSLQFAGLSRCYPLDLSATDLQCLLDLVGGHPYLARQALYVLASTTTTLDELKRLAIRPDGPFGDHLRRLAGPLLRREPLRQAVLQILRGKPCEDEDSFQRLFAAGLATGASRHEARCLYADYFKAML